MHTRFKLTKQDWSMRIEKDRREFVDLADWHEICCYTLVSIRLDTTLLYLYFIYTSASVGPEIHMIPSLMVSMLGGKSSECRDRS